MNQDGELDAKKGGIDITALVQTACESMSYANPLVCRETFNLYDSMSALDLMEPKMDGCQIPIEYYQNFGATSNEANVLSETGSGLNARKQSDKQIYVPPRPIPKTIRESSLVWDFVSITENKDESNHTSAYSRQVAVILLEMLVRLESYLSGNSVAESIYTCIYAHNSILQDMQQQLEAVDFEENPRLNFQKAIYLGALLMVKLSLTIRKIVKRADIYEEEDFNTTTNQFDFYPAFSEDENSMKELIQMIDDVISKLDEEFAPSDKETVKNLEIMRHALRYMTNLYQACEKLTSLTQENVMESAASLQNDIYKNHSQMQQYLKNNSGDAFGYTEKDKLTIFRTFDPYINRHLFGNTPVRTVIFLPPTTALKNLNVIYYDLGKVVCNLFIKGDTLGRIRRMLSRASDPSLSGGNDMSAVPTTVQNILTRSLTVINLYFDDQLLGSHNLALLIAKEMQRYGVPQILTSTEFGIQFLNRLCKPIYDTLKLHTLNRNRQRTYLGTMFQDWAQLQRDASTVDMLFQQEFQLNSKTTYPYVSNYALLISIELMDHYIGLGVELGLFNGHYHLLTAFWYRDFLLSAKLNVVTSIRGHLKERRAMEAQIRKEELESMNAQDQTQGGKSGKGKSKGKKGKKGGKRGGNAVGSKKAGGVNKVDLAVPENPSTPEDEEDNSEYLLLSVERTLCRGIVRVSVKCVIS